MYVCNFLFMISCLSVAFDTQCRSNNKELPDRPCVIIRYYCSCPFPPPCGLPSQRGPCTPFKTPEIHPYGGLVLRAHLQQRISDEVLLGVSSRFQTWNMLSPTERN
ncbi:hypothetical protein V8C44DRAFT_319169 [Trichoderma aethiopicum]